MKYPIGLPVRDNGSGIIYFVHSHGKVAGVVNVIDEHGNVFGWAISLLTPLTEAEYYNEVMKPEGWELFNRNNEKIYQRDMGYDSFIEINESSEEPRYFCEAAILLTREKLKEQDCALDHYEALTAIKNYTL